MKTIFVQIVILISLAFSISCNAQNTDIKPEKKPIEISLPKPQIIADSFACPIGKTEIITEVKDNKDDWYNAQNFGVNDHLGEDWNKNSGGNTDCGEAVYAIANGRIVYAENAGPGWGNVIIIEHVLPDGTKVQSLYGHLKEILKTSGEVKKREQIGTVGNADGKYYCHLHLELREENCPVWNEAGGGYSADRKGWLDPSDFIDAHRSE